ncbi:unnamed protein product [Protopolystoma xenopodis]|uniref:Serine-threonine/tyrosine-protein kinase catalytic domain-containing protein n=1 Tax=Protopolystoma xenopodis TaxID=117903 RepID=A0A3S5BNY1_9PLAT|nr:unnamed protein product [Protopolystoma xenopodis]
MSRRLRKPDRTIKVNQLQYNGNQSFSSGVLDLRISSSCTFVRNEILPNTQFINTFSLCNLKSGNYLSVPPGWLCYLAPEIIKLLNLDHTLANNTAELPFTTQSDVFAFGSEILLQCWAYQASRRPEFTSLVRSLDRLPKLHRSPSYPAKPPSASNSSSHDALIS